ncbi:MAG: hypothetical protein ACNA8W_03640 [Bradymonadaceae bacterium]
MENLIVVVLYIAIPATILTIAFVAMLRKEQDEVEEDKRHEAEHHPQP